MRVVVIGGGLAGLTVADKLKHKSNLHTTIFESRDFIGGRIRSVYSCDACETKRLLYESGPWRIPSTHTNMIKLCEDLGLTLDDVQTNTPPPFAPPLKTQRGLSVWESYALQARNPATADKIDLDSGYADETYGADITYAAAAQERQTYKTVREGFSEIPLRLKERIQTSGNVRILSDCRVVDLIKNGDKYAVQCVERKGNKFETVNYKADVVFVCVPPHACRDWTALKAHASPVLHAVMSKPLNHIYAHGEHIKGIHIRVGESLLAQSISTQYPERGQFIPPYTLRDAVTTGWYQLSYSAGRVARFWYNLFINNTPRFYQLLFHEAGKISVGRQPLFRKRNVKMHFWEHAVHAWKPTPNFDVHEAVAKARQPHPFRLPQVYFAGEAFSKEQAWMEGALTTAHAAVDDFIHKRAPTTRIRASDSSAVAVTQNSQLLAIDGRIIDVSSWSCVHPGGKDAIKKHLRDTDIHDLFKHIGHSENAWAIIFGLQVGFVQE